MFFSVDTVLRIVEIHFTLGVTNRFLWAGRERIHLNKLFKFEGVVSPYPTSMINRGLYCYQYTEHG
jgi:hypothetical protein